MSGIRRVLAMAAEAIAAIRSQSIVSIVSIVVVAGMCATVFLTTGRTVGAEQSVLSVVDEAGTRSIIVRAEPDAGLDSTVVDRISRVGSVEWVGAFGPSVDAFNYAVTGGERVALRQAWGTDLEEFAGSPPAIDDSVWPSRRALELTGMVDGTGAVETVDGRVYSVIAEFETPEFLDFLEPLAVAPMKASEPGPVAVLVVIASTPSAVSLLSSIIETLLGISDPTKVSFETSADLAKLRVLIEGELRSFGRSLVLVVFAATGVLVAAIFYGLVTLRRKDFGRRRALGASQRLIVGLVLMQVAVLAGVGTMVGAIVGLIALVASGDPLPGFDFVVATCVLATGFATAAGTLPAAVAARRDPIKELRVP